MKVELLKVQALLSQGELYVGKKFALLWVSLACSIFLTLAFAAMIVLQYTVGDYPTVHSNSV